MFIKLRTILLMTTLVKNRPQNAALLCCHFARNFAYYSVFRQSPHLGETGFWLTVHGNFIDICVLEWCKLFGNKNGIYHWRRTLTDPERFCLELLNSHGINETELKRLWKEVKDYRDDFVAHSEKQETTPIPNMNIPYLLVEFYFRKLLLDFPTLQTNSSLPAHFDQYYDARLKEAEVELLHAKNRVHENGN